MSVLEDFMSDAKVFADKASRKVNETYEIAKLKTEKIRIQNRIDASYQSLGEAVYAHDKTGEDVTKIYNTLTAQLDSDFAKISEIYQEIEKVKTIYGSYEGPEDYDDDLEEEIDEEEEEDVCDADEESEEQSEEPEEKAPYNDGIELEAD